MKSKLTLLFLAFVVLANAQTASIKGVLQDPEGAPVIYANVILYNAADSSMVKVENSDEAGVFRIQGLAPGTYDLVATYVGADDLRQSDLSLTDGQQLDLGVISFASTAVELEGATVTATRALVEIKPDRTVFNVQGTINSTGDNALSLLRKAPSVSVDNNDNVSVLGRAGVRIFVDGKQLPLSGDDLSNYLQNLPADQIDRIDIITNPGARYDAEGNAGIIDIRLKKDKSLGANGTVGTTVSQGRYGVANINASANYRNRSMNVFATAGAGHAERFNNMEFESQQNGLQMDEYNLFLNERDNYNFRLGTDFFLSKQHTLGFLASGNYGQGNNRGFNRITLATQANPNNIDSILVANNNAQRDWNQTTYNINYRFDNGQETSLNLDADYGAYRTDVFRDQPNVYYDANEEQVLTEIINSFETPTDIDIYTVKADYEQKFLGGKLGIGTKYSRVESDNTFLFNDVVESVTTMNDSLSNIFDYDENVYAGYVSFVRPINPKWSMSLGLRVEHTDAVGNLQAFRDDLMEPPVELNYTNWFPNAGLTWQAAPMHTLQLNYGRRINRPDYQVLNPFNSQLSQLSYEKGNPFLRPEIVNNIELGYTLKYRYNFKLGYSLTTNQITRLIAPDENDERANFITWENLAEQQIYSFSASLPTQLAKGWNAYFNFGASYINNQADYGEGAVVDVQAFTYSMYQQHTFDLPFGFKGEISGWFSGPGVWGGVFKYETSWSLNVGLQRKFLQDRLNVRISGNDLFYESGWEGVSVFNGLTSAGFGNWDSRRVSMSLTYNFGNNEVKSSRRRKTGLEDEASRLGE